MITKQIFLYSLFTLITLNANTIDIKGGIYKIPPFKSFYVDKKEQIVQIKDFKIDKYEVSNKLFGKKGINEDEQNYPVVKIKYQDAIKYCKQKGGDLPTKEQWLVASSFENNQFYQYSTKNYPLKNENDINIVQDRAVELEIDGFGAEFDLVEVQDALVGNNNIVAMLGNVWELTKSNTQYVYLKGGSFFNNEKKELLNNYIENRVLKSDLDQYEHIGFRCVYKK
ncbi:MAG: SUMF1/EgtB/PvdO family nonheme iron enzyme [Campylobacterota bacterium]|nr:SUMF1/EgtB/PvdO family nonheme iron enzyme [Campylobacterota bacterium]